MNPVWFEILTIVIAIMFNLGILFWVKSRGNYKKPR
ncbi:hypothetical protein FORC087_071 (plasmid) [Bacillus cereus]|nr:hypothetical protein FORC087_071 [Bacillus cereus]